MFGVFMRRWRPKRASNDRNESPSTDGSISPEPPDRPPGKAKVHPEEKTQAFAYESFRRKSKPKTLELEENNQMYNHLANTNVAMSPVYPLTPNICVEGGKIEFIKTPSESVRNSAAFSTPPQSPLLAARRSSRDKREMRDEFTEKFDDDKELLEKRIKQLESELEEERRRTQRERMAVVKLQNKLLKREGAARSDAERERRARGDWEARARTADADAARLAAKLHAAQREIARMEETVQSLLQYKSRVDTLKQEKASLSTALEKSSTQYANQVSALGAENERLRSQLAALSSGADGAPSAAPDDQERRLDEVAQQVVRVLLSQKNVREELCCARARVRELEAQNRALSALLVRQLRPQPRPSPVTPRTPPTPHDLHVHVVESGSCGALALAALSADDKRRHHILADVWTELKGLEVTPANLARALSAVEPALWASPARPHTLSLGLPHHNTDREGGGKCASEEGEVEGGSAGAESPESGAKDEGYSTMSSDVQADASRQSEHAARALPDLNEASDETDNQTIVSMERHSRLAACTRDDLPYLPLAFGGRASYPPARPLLPFQHVMRSFSDSHLCLKLLADACVSSRLDTASPGSGVLVLDLTPAPDRPLRRALIAPVPTSERSSWASVVDERAQSSQYDAEYVQHWLELDDARSALQQRHRDLADLDYDRAELEDWSLSLSCEDLRDRHSPFAEIATPGQISLSTLPSIREDDALELEEDVGECLWNECGFATVDADDCRPTEELETGERRWRCAGTHSPAGSWSTGSDAPDAPDTRSAAGFSEDGECANVGLDFTRDFYRLVKYESTKSLASNSSRGIGASASGTEVTPLRVHDVQAVALQDREQALQSVLNFIAEQQRYCRDREESDSAPSRPVSEVRELPPPYAPADFDDESGPRSDLSDERPRPDSFGSFSEGDSCHILIGEPQNALYRETVSEPRSTPRFIEREDPYVESEDYYDELLTMESEANEEEHHLLNVQRKNEINRSIDLNHIAEDSGEPPPTNEKVGGSRADEERQRIEDDSITEKDNVTTKHMSVENDVDTVNVTSKCTKFPFSDGEVGSSTEAGCTGRRAALVTVPEEEEGSSPDTSSPQLTESVTTSTSTTETVILSNRENGVKKEGRNKNEKSRIPTLLGAKRPPASPSRARSRIPVAERRPPHQDLIVRQEHTLSFHEAATSKDVIDELNRMIRQNENPGTRKKGMDAQPEHKDNELWAPTSWIHVEKDIDFSDPKTRANLLDVMLASSDSSPSSSSSSPAEAPAPVAAPGPAPAPAPAQPYSRLHRLHRSRRQKTAAALRSRGLAVLREARSRRPSILGREGFFVRFGPCERHALASFDFLDELASPDPPKDCT